MPDVRSLDVRRWLARHERLADVGLMLLVLGLMVQPLLRAEGCGCAPVPWWGYGLVLAECLLLVWRRQRPFGTAVVVGMLSAVHGLSTVPEAALVFPALVGLYSLAAYGTRLESLVGAGLGAVLLGAVLLADPTDADLQDATVSYLVLAAAWLLGDGARSRRERAVELEARMAQIEQTRAAQAERAVADERARIAREMHDVVAHHVSMMVVQAEAGPVVVHRDPDRASQVFDSISATGKQALTEMRRLLGVLRTDESAGLAPQPGIAALPALAERCRAAGLPVDLDVGDLGGPLPPGVDLSTYRIVQEALTNVLKHAGPAAATATVRRAGDAITVRVHDDGLGPRGTSSAPAGGNGLIGMRERTALHRGELHAGPDEDGGWTVTARLLLDPAPAGQVPAR